ncbi:MAG: DsbA family protein, partial [Dermabacter sp.]|nr:DsbA family protein [Dermabacter sp.]
MTSPKTSHESALSRLVTTRRAALAAGGATAAVLLAACGNSGSKEGKQASDSGASDATPALPEPTQSAAVSVPFDESKPYLEFNPDSEGPAVELLVDYRCPHCKLFAEAQDKDIRELVEKGYINYRVYPRPMLDKATGLTFSNDTASAVVASWVEDPKLFWDMNEAMFA